MPNHSSVLKRIGMDDRLAGKSFLSTVYSSSTSDHALIALVDFYFNALNYIFVAFGLPRQGKSMAYGTNLVLVFERDLAANCF